MLVLVAVALFACGRRRLLLDELLAGGLAVGLALLAGWLAGTDWSESVKAVVASGAPPVYLAVRLALATAVVVMASPYMARPLRYVGRAVVGVGAVAGIALGTSLPIGMVAAFAVGIGSACRWVAASRSSMRPSSPCWPSGPGSGCSRWWRPGWPRIATRCW